MEATMGATKYPGIEVREHPGDKHHRSVPRRSEQRPKASRKSFDVSIKAMKYPTPPSGNVSFATPFPLVIRTKQLLAMTNESASFLDR
jgi:hypothetical protein